tara:strand:- start:28953 stop:29189 length:237 start_codon:yes stop_codon:yes gene_type:complete
MPDGSTVTEADILEMFGAFGDNEIFRRFLRDMAAQDIRLYFQASNERDRQLIRGGHARVLYFISLITKSNERRKRNKG